jgi:dihydroorotate dehydrogenase
MSWLYRNLLRPAFFRHDPEAVHNFTLHTLARVGRHPTLCEAVETVCGAEPLPVTAFGLRFPNPVGLAAGMDKAAEAAPVWAALGFGHAELGAVTWHAQPGNPPPRIFRAVPARALINRMGFNNPGAEAVATELEHWQAAGRRPAHPLGINLGKSKITPLAEAAADYANSFRRLWALADFFVVNVSSPNTPNLRQLQDRAALDEILAALQQVNATMARETRTATPATPAPFTHHASRITPKPILVKVAPDLTFEALDEILDVVQTRRLAGIVATNTTLARPATDDARLQRVYAEAGGLSGAPLRERSTAVIRHLHRQSVGRLPIIGVGGIFTADDAWEKITAGACLVQIYTGYIYEGPTQPRRIVAGLRERLAREGFRTLAEAVGTTAA